MNDIIVDVGYDGVRVALLENKELAELFIEKEDNRRILGNIYKGRVVNVLPGMQAAFVDIGLEKNAFLYVKDAVPKDLIENNNIDINSISINDVLKQGQEIIVQIIKEPSGSKGARISTHITLPGRYLVLMPYTNFIGISRRITDENERIRLKSIIDEIKDEGFGIILRTASQFRSKEDLLEDINFLKGIFNKLNRERNLGVAPKILFKDLNLINRTLRDIFTTETNKLIINDREEYNNIIEFVRHFSDNYKEKVQCFDKAVEIFDYYGIEKMIQRALNKKVWLKSGGYIIIDETEALTSIDVNTGKFVGSVDLEHTVYKTNLEAAKEIAKQLRLRNIGGIIIIDFIDMKNNEEIKNVIDALENELKKDRIRSTVLGMTRLGLVEMTRKKNRKRLSSQVLTKCLTCNGTGKVFSIDLIIDKIEKIVSRSKDHTIVDTVLFDVNPIVYNDIIKNYINKITNIEKIYDMRILLQSNEKNNFNEINICRLGKVEDI